MKIIAIDGGGIRGVFPVAILKRLEEDHNRPIHELFDMIAGTSTGAIIAGAIATGKPMADLLERYRTYGKQIFVKQAQFGLFKTVYTDKHLRRFLKQELGDTMLADIHQPLLIPSVDITHGEPHVYRTKFGEESEAKDQEVFLWDAVLSSCSAPLYFPPNTTKQLLTIDGGLWANNPSLLCLTEALHHYHKKLEDIHIFSLGTGQQDIRFSPKKGHAWGIRKWFPIKWRPFTVTPKLLDFALHLSSESLSYHCQLLLGEQFYRVNEKLSGEVPFDDVTQTESLISLANQVYEEKKQDMNRFLGLN
ncbi:CBASS cGAMP-activated phospholipase [Desertibacillus haloalkaliphilus]|uniref:CBASS cGAMP-activated phospholipase n=1 Tax=Desertibacillus haloalkaliphilus TaxID=1328930 RepID=UPI001C25C63B|nr:CBASS cGAMP-activated phospholipase [Desertibacillus haloalkaliphilus]MBU8904980.1 patatin-like phospholipase family protein [Desertibacillus haloalkaliphilus]